MGQKIAKNLNINNKENKSKDNSGKKKSEADEDIDDFEIRIDLVFPEFEIRHDSIDNMFQGVSVIDKMKSDYEYSKIDKSVWIQDINDEIQINRKFGRKLAIPFWVKKYKKSEENEKLFLNELLILSNLSHPYIITEKDYFQDDDYYYLVFEDYPGQPILEYYMKNKKKIGYTEIKLMIRDLLNVLKYIHMKKITVRNLSPQNIYYDGENLQLCNFERAEFYEEVREEQTKGKDKKKKQKILKFKEIYLNKCLQAPEMKKKSYSYEADVWCIGLVYLIFFQNAPKGLDSSIFKLRQQIIDEFCPGFTLEIAKQNENQLRRKSTLQFKRKLSKKLSKTFQNKTEIEKMLQQEEENQQQQKEEKDDDNLIIDLTKRPPYRDLLLELLKVNPKKRLKLEEVEEQGIFVDRIKQEDEQSFMDASLSIYNFSKRNENLTPLKAFYVSNLMQYKIKSKFARIQNCFDLDGSGYLDQAEFIQGVKRSSPETTNKEAKKIYKQIDTDNNGFIEFEEFCVAFLADDFVTSQQILKQLFEYFVEDDRRVIIKEKLFKGLEMTSSKYKKVRELVKENEELDLQLFLSMFRKIKSLLQTRQQTRRKSKFVKIVADEN